VTNLDQIRDELNAASTFLWHAIYTRPRHEKRVLEDLTTAKVAAFLPTFKVRRKWVDRNKTIEEPLFKNYVFVNINQEQQRRCLRPRGAVGFVTFNAQPAIIPAEEIENIRKLVTLEIPYNPYPYLKAGRRVRVKDGPLEGCEGVLIRKKSICRLVISVHMLQRSVITEIDAACVQPL
jgi:transcription antitermination factor NusG